MHLLPKHIKKTFLFCFLYGILFLIHHDSFAQNDTKPAQNKDAELWMGVEINKRITKKLSGSFGEQLRLNDNVLSIKNIFSEIGLSYRFSKYLKVGAHYRFIKKNEKNSFYSTRHRFYGDVGLRYKIKPVTFSIRTRYQAQRQISNDGVVINNYSRNRLKVQFDLDKRFSPYITAEIYYYINYGLFNKVRYTVGFNLDLKKRQELSFFYRLQKELNVNNPLDSYIIGINYAYTLKGKLF